MDDEFIINDNLENRSEGKISKDNILPAVII